MFKCLWKRSQKTALVITFGFFVKHGIDHIHGSGKLGFILPNTILTQDSYEELRSTILKSCLIESILSFEELPFKDAVVENTVLVLRKSNGEQKENDVQISHIDERFKIVARRRTAQRLFKENYKSSFNIHIDEKLLILKKKLGVHTETIGSFLDINQGIALKHDRAKYLGDKKKSAQYKPVLDGRHINRYSLTWNGNFLKYEIAAIHSCKREDIFLSKEKLLFRRVGDRLIAAYDDGQFYALNTLVVMNSKVDSDFKIKYFLGLFNSRLLNFYYQVFLKSTKKVFSEIQARQVSQLPIKNVKFSTSENKAMHDKIVKLVEQILELNRRLAEAKTGHDKTVLQRRIDATDREIDQLVYELYDLTEAEIKIVEKSVK